MFCIVFRSRHLCLLPQIPSGLLEVEVALLVCPSGTKAGTDEGRPRSALEQQDGEDDAEAEAEGGFDDEVRQAAIPLRNSVSPITSWHDETLLNPIVPFRSEVPR